MSDESLETIKQTAEIAAEETVTEVAEAVSEAAEIFDNTEAMNPAQADEADEPAGDSCPADISETDVEASEEDEDSEEEVKEKPYRGSIPAAILAGIVGGFVGILLVTLIGGITNNFGIFSFFFIPVCIAGATALFKGNRGIPGLISMIVFTALGLYLVPTFCAAAERAARSGVSLLSTPLLATTMIGSNNFLTDFALNTAHVFPVLFCAAGVLFANELLKLKGKKQATAEAAAEAEVLRASDAAELTDAETETATDTEAANTQADDIIADNADSEE